jgi:predicted nuclease of restriction endonuclease-like (RecB) superfamily
MELACQGQKISTPADTIKNPYILDFLGLPDSQVHHESEIEKAIIDNLQSFLLELGKGFASVCRQKRNSTATTFISIWFFTTAF